MRKRGGMVSVPAPKVVRTDHGTGRMELSLDSSSFDLRRKPSSRNRKLCDARQHAEVGQ